MLKHLRRVYLGSIIGGSVGAILTGLIFIDRPFLQFRTFLINGGIAGTATGGIIDGITGFTYIIKKKEIDDWLKLNNELLKTGIVAPTHFLEKYLKEIYFNFYTKENINKKDQKNLIWIAREIMPYVLDIDNSEDKNIKDGFYIIEKLFEIYELFNRLEKEHIEKNNLIKRINLKKKIKERIIKIHKQIYFSKNQNKNI